MTVRIIDTETTGTDPSADEICEIASVDLKKVDGLFCVRNPLSTFAAISKPMPPEASAAHHIVDKDLIGAPPIDQALVPFTEHDDAELVFVAHNADFERAFLKPWLRSQRWICTYKVALRVLPDLPSHSNQFLRYYFGLVEPFGMARESIAPHRALSDCYVTAAVFVQLALLSPSYAQMFAWSDEPPLKSRITFGKKHKGLRYDDPAVPTSYLRWIINESDLDEPTKFSAQHWLDQRAEAENQKLMAGSLI
ncbi:exonuclease domain-containing protein [Hyphomicrobium sp. 99]|uniref:exonuclease domain-containing protein n=1 Tax=Hyphomicrobium sp. 99 TaxID=1163419 RepID=UPI0005F79518|nr:exonuclease domain-containing protein [Hyphomicrobium sp. 99]